MIAICIDLFDIFANSKSIRIEIVMKILINFIKLNEAIYLLLSFEGL